MTILQLFALKYLKQSQCINNGIIRIYFQRGIDLGIYPFIIFLIDRNMRDFRLRLFVKLLNQNFYSDFPDVSLYLQCTVFIVFINEKPDEFRNFSENSIRWRLIFILQTNLSQYYIHCTWNTFKRNIIFSLRKLCNSIEMKLHVFLS